jgi:hypothetical protein
MSYQSYAPYRGFSINVRVTPAATLSFHGVGHRYKVSWTISSYAHPGREIASFPERLGFLSEQEAFRYAENRAHTFIDCMLSGAHDMRFLSEVAQRRQHRLGPIG